MSFPGDDSKTTGENRLAASDADRSAFGGRVDFFVIQDYKENRRKCTVQPLAELEGLELLRLGIPIVGEELVGVPAGILLEVDAPVLVAEDALHLSGGGRLVLLDATWVRLAPLVRRLCFEGSAGIQRRSLPGDFRTAYPRHSKLFEDPAGGLASVEAMFASTVILGAPREELLQHYRWAGEFLELNREVLSGYGWDGARGEVHG